MAHYGTYKVKDINSGSATSYPEELTAIGETLYFRADDGNNGNELWKRTGPILGRSWSRTSTLVVQVALLKA